MSLDIDPKWEYWTPDPELEVKEENVLDIGFKEESNPGLRFGRGNPNAYPFLKLKSEKHRQCKPIESYLPKPRGRPVFLSDYKCVVCGKTYRPDRSKRVTCSRACGGKLGGGRSKVVDLVLFKRIYHSGLTFKEIGKVVGLSAVQVKKMRKKLRLYRTKGRCYRMREAGHD